jgi:hypothetical protein
LNVPASDVLSLSLGKLLERKEFIRFPVDGDNFTIQHEAFGRIFDTLNESEGENV